MLRLSQCNIFHLGEACARLCLTVLPVHLPLFPLPAPLAAIPWQTFYQLIFLLLSLSDKTFIKLPRFANPQHSERPFGGCFGAAPNSRTPTHTNTHTYTYTLVQREDGKR